MTSEKQKSSKLLYITLAVNIVLFLVNIFKSGAVIASATEESLLKCIWMNATQGGSIYATAGIIVCVIIGALFHLNRMLGDKKPGIAKIVAILLKIPVNLVLLGIALWLVFIGVAKFNTGTDGANLLGGGYLLDWVNSATILFLVFFVKKV